MQWLRQDHEWDELDIDTFLALQVPTSALVNLGQTWILGALVYQMSQLDLLYGRKVGHTLTQGLGWVGISM
jgi:hypothetical protein